MLFVATHTHHAAKCPLETPEANTMMKKLFSDDNIRKSGLKIVGAYVSCPKDKSSEHKGYSLWTPTVAQPFQSSLVKWQLT